MLRIVPAWCKVIIKRLTFLGLNTVLQFSAGREPLPLTPWTAGFHSRAPCWGPPRGNPWQTLCIYVCGHFRRWLLIAGDRRIWSKRPILLKYRYLLTPLFLEVLHIHECTNTYDCSYFGGDGGNLGCGREGTISVCSQFFLHYIHLFM